MAVRDVAALSPVAPSLPRADNVELSTRPWAREFAGSVQIALGELYKTVALLLDESGDLVDGVIGTLPLHASTHLPSGSDPLATGVPVSVALVNAPGVANAFSRADHAHALDVSADYHFTGAVTIDNLIGGALAFGSPGNVDLQPNAPGIATTGARSDHHHKLDEAISPLWTGAHRIRVANDVVGLTIERGSAQTSAKLFAIEFDTTIPDYLHVSNSGLVALNDESPGAHWTIRATGIDPSTIGGGPYAWFKADAITTGVDGARLVQWDDSSGNARHAAGALGFGPEYLAADPGLNNKPALLFASNTGWYNGTKPTNGTSRYRSIVGGPHAFGDYTIFAVQRPFSPNDYYDGLFLGNEGTVPTEDNRMTTRTNARSEVYYQDNAGNVSWGGIPPFTPPAVPADGAAVVACFTRTGSANKYRHNGTEYTSTSATYNTAGVTSTAFRWMSIGGIADNAGTAHWGNKVLAEIIIYATALSASDVLAVEGYLNAKYNLNGGGTSGGAILDMTHWKDYNSVIRTRVDNQGRVGIGVVPLAPLHVQSTTVAPVRVSYDTSNYLTLESSASAGVALTGFSGAPTGNNTVISLSDGVTTRGAETALFQVRSGETSPFYGARAPVGRVNNLGEWNFGFGVLPGSSPGSAILSFIANTSEHPSWATRNSTIGILSFIDHADTLLATTGIMGISAWGHMRSGSLTPAFPVVALGVQGGFSSADDRNIYSSKTAAAIVANFSRDSSPVNFKGTSTTIDTEGGRHCPTGDWDHVTGLFVHKRAFKTGGGGSTPVWKPRVFSSARLPIQGCAIGVQCGVYGVDLATTQPAQNIADDGYFARIPFPSNTSIANRAALAWVPFAGAAGGPVAAFAGGERGEYFDDGTNNSVGSYEHDGTNWFRRRATFFTATADAALTNTVTETSIVGTGAGSATLPAKLLIAGRTIRVRMFGRYSTDVAPPTLRFKLKLIDSVPATVVVLDTGAVTLGISAAHQFFEIVADITCRTTGAAGTVYAQGRTIFAATATTALVVEMNVGGTGTAAVATATIDTTRTELVEITATWGTANANNTLTSTNMTIEVLN